MSHSPPRPESGLNVNQQAGRRVRKRRKQREYARISSSLVGSNNSQQLPLPAGGAGGLKGSRNLDSPTHTRTPREPTHTAERGQRCHLRPDQPAPVPLHRSTPFFWNRNGYILPNSFFSWKSPSLWNTGPCRLGMEPQQEALGCAGPASAGAGGVAGGQCWHRADAGLHTQPTGHQRTEKDAENKRTDRSEVGMAGRK